MLHTQYRPETWASFIGNEKAVREARGALAIQRQKLAQGTAKDGLAFQVIGISGAGKSTMAQLIARECGAMEVDAMDYMELDGDKCDAYAVRALEQSGGFLSTRPWGKAKAIVVNEHAGDGTKSGMTPKAVQAWLTLLERLPKWAVVVFTSTESPELFGNFAGPFSRRCININLSNQGLAGPFAARLVEVAKCEGYELPHKVAVRMIQDASNNLGRAIEELGKLLAERKGGESDGSVPVLAS